MVTETITNKSSIMADETTAEETLHSNSPSKVNPISVTEDSIEISTRAYVKMVLHVAKYPHSFVNGVLLAKMPPKGQKPGNTTNVRLVLIDTIPLFHQVEGLSPMVEVALAQIERKAASIGMIIAGYYHANRQFKDTTVDVFSQRIADRIANLTGNTALLTFDNKKLGLQLETHALLAQLPCDPSDTGGATRWRRCASTCIRVDEDTCAVASEFVQNRGYKDLIDFDNHLDDITQDYLNVDLNMEIDRLSD